MQNLSHTDRQFVRTALLGSWANKQRTRHW